MKVDVNSVKGVLTASKHFLRTREGFHTAPSVRGFARHVEANMRLYEAFVSSGSGVWAHRLAFGVWRSCLRLGCDLKNGVGRLLRWF